MPRAHEQLICLKPTTINVPSFTAGSLLLDSPCSQYTLHILVGVVFSWTLRRWLLTLCDEVIHGFLHCHQLQGINAQYLLKLRRRIQNVAADLAIKLPEARRALEDFIRELEIQMSSQETKSQVHIIKCYYYFYFVWLKGGDLTGIAYTFSMTKDKTFNFTEVLLLHLKCTLNLSIDKLQLIYEMLNLNGFAAM